VPLLLVFASRVRDRLTDPCRLISTSRSGPGPASLSPVGGAAVSPQQRAAARPRHAHVAR
jgi:hypothetical protein